MSDTVGIIASASTTSVATTTVYTVPATKSLIFKPMFIGQANAGGSTFKLTVNGVDLFQSGAITASYYFWSSAAAMFLAASAYPDGLTLAKTVAPGFAAVGFGGYYASAGHVISYTVGTGALISLGLFLVGSLIDA